MDVDVAGLFALGVVEYDFVAVEGVEREPGQGGEGGGICGGGAGAPDAGGGDDDAGEHGEADGDQVGGVDAAYSDCAVDAFGDEVGHAVVEQPFDGDVGVLLEELDQRGDELLLAEHRGYEHPQLAARFVLHAAQIGLDGLPAFQQFLGVAVAALAVFGEFHHVGGALQQVQAHEALELLQASADGGLGGGLLLCGGRKAARFDDTDEGFEQIESVGAV